MLRLHFDPASTTSRSVTLFTHSENIPVEYRQISLQNKDQLTPEFLALNPSHGVPVLEHDDFVLAESSAILKYLADLHGSSAYPTEAKARARVNEAMDWFNTGFYAAFGYSLIYPQVLDHYRWPDAAQQAAAVARFTPMAHDKFSQLEQKLAKTGAYVCGDEITIADYFGAALVSLGEMIEFDLMAYPAVAAWMGRMKALPAWGPCYETFNGWCGHLASLRAAQ